jgi:hypothetical protein
VERWVLPKIKIESGILGFPIYPKDAAATRYSTENRPCPIFLLVVTNKNQAPDDPKIYFSGIKKDLGPRQNPQIPAGYGGLEGF